MADVGVFWWLWRSPAHVTEIQAERSRGLTVEIFSLWAYIKFFCQVEANHLYKYLFPVNFHKKTVLAVTILLRKVARCILGTSNLVLTLIEKTTRKTFSDQPWEAGLFLIGSWTSFLDVADMRFCAYLLALTQDVVL